LFNTPALIETVAVAFVLASGSVRFAAVTTFDPFDATAPKLTSAGALVVIGTVVVCGATDGAGVGV